jgi:hypothetical protein
MFAKKAMRPQYIHIVVNFDEPSASNHVVTQEEMFSVTSALKNHMESTESNFGDFDFIKSRGVSISTEDAPTINHDTIFMPSCFKPDPEGKFTESLNLMIAWLNKHSSRKTCSKPESIQKFLMGKFDLFLDNELSRTNFMAKDPNFVSDKLIMAEDDESPILKIVLLTLVLDETMDYDQEKLQNIKDSLIKSIDYLKK